MQSALALDTLDVRELALALVPHRSLAGYMLAFPVRVSTHTHRGAYANAHTHALDTTPRTLRAAGRAGAATGSDAGGAWPSASGTHATGVVPYVPPQWAHGAATHTHARAQPRGFVPSVGPEPTPRSFSGLAWSVQAHMSTWQRRMMCGEYALYAGDASACGDDTVAGSAAADLRILLSAAFDSVNYCIAAAAAEDALGDERASTMHHTRLHPSTPTLRALRDSLLVAIPPAVAMQTTHTAHTILPSSLRPYANADAVVYREPASAQDVEPRALHARLLAVGTSPLSPAERATLFADGTGQRWQQFFWSLTSIVDATTIVLNAASQWEVEPAVAEAVVMNRRRAEGLEAQTAPGTAMPGVQPTATSGGGSLLAGSADGNGGQQPPALVRASQREPPVPFDAEAALTNVLAERHRYDGALGTLKVLVSPLCADPVLLLDGVHSLVMYAHTVFPARVLPAPKSVAVSACERNRWARALVTAIGLAAATAGLVWLTLRGDVTRAMLLLRWKEDAWPGVALPLDVARLYGAAACIVVALGAHVWHTQRSQALVGPDLWAHPALRNVWLRRDNLLSSMIAGASVGAAAMGWTGLQLLCTLALGGLIWWNCARLASRAVGRLHEQLPDTLKWVLNSAASDAKESYPVLMRAAWMLIETLLLLRWLRRLTEGLYGQALSRYTALDSSMSSPQLRANALAAAAARQLQPVDPVAEQKAWVARRVALKQAAAGLDTRPPLGDVVATTLQAGVSTGSCADLRELTGCAALDAVREPAVTQRLVHFVETVAGPADGLTRDAGETNVHEDAHTPRSSRSAGGSLARRGRRSSAAHVTPAIPARAQQESVPDADAENAVQESALVAERRILAAYTSVSMALLLAAWAGLAAFAAYSSARAALVTMMPAFSVNSVAVHVATLLAALATLGAVVREGWLARDDVLHAADSAHAALARLAAGNPRALGLAALIGAAVVAATLSLEYALDALFLKHVLARTDVLALVTAVGIASGVRVFTTFANSFVDAELPQLDAAAWLLPYRTPLLAALLARGSRAALNGAHAALAGVATTAYRVLSALAHIVLFVLAAVLEAAGVLPALRAVMFVCRTALRERVATSAPGTTTRVHVMQLRHTHARRGTPNAGHMSLSYAAAPLPPGAYGVLGSLAMRMLLRSPAQNTAALLYDYKMTIVCIDLLVTALVDGARADRSGIVTQTLPTAIASLSACLAAVAGYVVSPRYVSAQAAGSFLHEWAWHPPTPTGAAPWSIDNLLATLPLGASSFSVSLGDDASAVLPKGDVSLRPAVAGLCAALVRGLRTLKAHLQTSAPDATLGRPAGIGSDAFDDIARRLPSPILAAVARAAVAGQL